MAEAPASSPKERKRAWPLLAKAGLAIGAIFIVFGAINVVSPMELHFFQVSCYKPMFFRCGLPPQEIPAWGVRVLGAASILLGLGVTWLALPSSRKPSRGHHR